MFRTKSDTPSDHASASPATRSPADDPNAGLIYGAGYAHAYSDAYLELQQLLSLPEAQGRKLEMLTLMLVEGLSLSEVLRNLHEGATAPAPTVRLRLVQW